MKLKIILLVTIFYVLFINTIIEAHEYDAEGTVINGRQTLIECKPEVNDELLYARHLEDKGRFMKKKRRTIYYPESGPGDSIIHCIKAIDNKGATSTHGGTVKILSGGLNESSVVLRITSERGKGYNYDLEIYGKKITNVEPGSTTTPEHSTVTVGTTEIPTVTVGSTEIPTVTIGSTEIPPITVNSSTGSTEIPTVTVGSTEIPTVTVGSTEIPTVTVGSTEIPTVTVGSTEIPTVTVGSTEIPTVTVGSTEIPTVTVGSTETPTVTVGSTEIPTVTVGSTVIPPITVNGSFYWYYNRLKDMKKSAEPIQ